MHTYDKANQLVSSTTDGKVTHYAYDAAGRLIKEGDKSYAYGWLDKVLSVTENGKPIASFNYHNDGQIAQTIHNGKSEDFLWDGLALIHRGETSFINEPYVTGGNPILSSKDGVIFNDMLGSTLNIGGKAVNMTAFGESTDTNAMYTGKPYIGELGYAFLFRNYRSDYGKWQTSDPLGYPDGWNNLAYCGNYPGMAIDRDGALWSWGAAGIGAAIGAVTNVAAYVTDANSVKINGLDEEAMAKWYNEFSTQKGQTWGTIGQNCAWTTAHTLMAGMTDPRLADLKKDMEKVTIWTPQDVSYYVNKIKKKLE